MEEVLIRFPHLGDKILKKLDSKSLINCKEVNRTFKNFMKVDKRSYLLAIQWYTNCSESLMKKIAEKSGGAIIILSILREIYGNFPRGTKQHHKYLRKWYMTPLHLAAESGQPGAYHLIMENVVDKNPLNMIADTMGCKYLKREKLHEFGVATPLHLAAKNGHLSVCKLIIENVLDKNPTASQIKIGDWSHLQSLYGEQRLDTRDRWTPLHLAANNGHFSVCELLINNISMKNPEDQHGWTPLHSAAQNGYLRVCKLILSNIHESKEYSTNYLCNPSDICGNTPLILAYQFCHEEVKKVLQEFIFDAKETKNAYLEKILVMKDLDIQGAVQKDLEDTDEDTDTVIDKEKDTGEDTDEDTDKDKDTDEETDTDDNLIREEEEGNEDLQLLLNFARQEAVQGPKIQEDGESSIKTRTGKNMKTLL